MTLANWTNVWQGAALIALPLAVWVNPWLLARVVGPRESLDLKGEVPAGQEPSWVEWQWTVQRADREWKMARGKAKHKKFTWSLPAQA